MPPCPGLAWAREGRVPAVNKNFNRYDLNNTGAQARARTREEFWPTGPLPTWFGLSTGLPT
jgi:hypothetical protein